MHEPNVGDTVARKSKGASTGRTGQVIELDGYQVRVHWTKKSNGEPMSHRSWINANELMVIKPPGTFKPILSEWLSLPDNEPPLETPLLVKHRYGVEAIQFHSAKWRYWYNSEPVDSGLMKTVTHFLIAKFPQ